MIWLDHEDEEEMQEQDCDVVPVLVFNGLIGHTHAIRFYFVYSLFLCFAYVAFSE